MLLCALMNAVVVQSQESRQRSVSGEAAAEALKQKEVDEDSTINWEKWNFGVRPRLEVEYNSNIYRNSTSVEGSKDDFILRPEIDFELSRAISDINSLDITLGVGIDYYTKHTSVNTYSPIISPDSDIAYHMFIGDTHVKFHEAFSYQEDVNSVSAIQSGGQYADVKATRFNRYQNRLGGLVEWDTGSLLLSASADWEYFYSPVQNYKYLNRNAGLFKQSATYYITPNFRTGLEFNDPVYFHTSKDFTYNGNGDICRRMNDQFRLQAGPFVELKTDSGITYRAGAGYDFAAYDDGGCDQKPKDLHDWYIYGSMKCPLLEWLDNNLTIRRDNSKGWNSDNLQGVFISDNIRVTLIRDFTFDLYAMARLGTETGIQYDGRNDKNSEYYAGGIRIGYSFSERWEPSFRYTYYVYSRENSSYDDYDVHQVMLAVQYTF